MDGFKSISVRKFDAGVVVFQDRIVFKAHFRKAVGAILAHPDAVSPAAAGERIACNAVSGIAFVDDE